VATLTERAIGAAMLNPEIYEEVEHDQNAMGQAAAVVAVSSLAAGIGAIDDVGIVGLIVTTIVSLGAWALWAAITMFVGTRLLPGPNTEADFGQLFRTLGFASAPGVLAVAGIIPLIGTIIAFGAYIWQLVAMVIAVRQALDYDTTLRAVAVCAIGFVPYALVFSVLLGWVYRMIS
jgi:Yip1-like protein